MKKYALLTMVGAVIGGGLLSGCVVTGTTYVRAEPRPRYYYERREVIVAPPPAVVVAPAPPAVVVVRRPPPPVVVERITIAPGPEYVWVPGYHAVRGDDWVWVSGHYERPPRPGMVWVAPRYEQHGSEFHFSMGFWR